MLTTLLLIPFVGGLVLLLLPASVAPVRMRSVAIVVLTLQLLLSLALLTPFDPSVGTPQLVEFTPWVSRIGLDYRLAVDGPVSYTHLTLPTKRIV